MKSAARAHPLVAAVLSTRLDNAAWLVAHGADVNVTDTAGGHVLRHALFCKDQALVDFVRRAGSVPDAATRELARIENVAPGQTLGRRRGS